jgi:hypothetical protein
MLGYKVCRVNHELVQAINCTRRICEQQSMRKCDRCRAWICANARARYILFELGLGLFDGDRSLSLCLRLNTADCSPAAHQAFEKHALLHPPEMPPPGLEKVWRGTPHSAGFQTELTNGRNQLFASFSMLFLFAQDHFNACCGAALLTSTLKQLQRDRSG